MQGLVLGAVTPLLLGNSDSHGKNISFFVDRTGLTPTSLYELVSVVHTRRFITTWRWHTGMSSSWTRGARSRLQTYACAWTSTVGTSHVS